MISLNNLKQFFAKLNISNYATKADIQTLSTQLEAIQKSLQGMGSALFYAGQVTNYSDLPTENVTNGAVYNIVNADTDNGIKAGDNVVWNGTVWDNMSGVVDLSPYLTASSINSLLTSVTSNGSATITVTDKSGTSASFTVNNVDYATSAGSATNDGLGQNIAETYITKIELIEE